MLSCIDCQFQKEENKNEKVSCTDSCSVHGVRAVRLRQQRGNSRGSLIPMLTLGIPGESVTAVLMGGLVIQGLAPGPELFTKHADMTYTFFAGFVLVQFFMLAIGTLGCRGFAQISRLSDAILIPCVTVLCFVGSYAIHKNLSDVVVMLIFGGLGYLMRKFDLNTAAVVLALILGPISEKGLRGALRVSGGDLGCLFASPVSWVLIVLSVIGIFSRSSWQNLRRKSPAAKCSKSNHDIYKNQLWEIPIAVFTVLPFV